MGSNLLTVTETRADVLAYRLSSRIDDLARALARAGAEPAASMRLLELAAVAAVHAVGLTELTAPPQEEAGSAPEPLPLAAAA